MIGQSLGPFKIEQELGAGGMGTVYKATDTKLRRGRKCGATQSSGAGPAFSRRASSATDCSVPVLSRC